MTKTKISDKYQVVIPKILREQLLLKRGQKLITYILDSHIIMIPESKNYTESMAGLGKEIWRGIDPIEYVRKERQEWEKK